MSEASWQQGLLGHTRWRIVTLLRPEPKSVRELATALGVTDNAVRPHLATLERDGFVRQKGMRYSGGKPAHVYELLPLAGQLFPKAYGLILNRMIAVMGERLSENRFREIVEETGKRLASAFPPASGSAEQRLRHAVEVVADIGGMAVLAQEGNRKVIQGFQCPFFEAAAGNPEVCRLAEILLSEITGLPIKERCQKGDSPRCSFYLNGSATP